MIVALILGLVLVAIPLYLWRRPRAESIAAATADAGAAAMPAASAFAKVTAPGEDTKPTLTDAKVLACQDPGSKKTPPEQCDHLVDVEKAIAKAIEDTASCVTKEAGGGTILYVADVSFKKKSIGIATPKDGRSLKSGRTASACQNAVKGKVSGISLEGVGHEHARYKIAITATYPGPVKP